MAVARIKATKRWHLTTAEVVKDHKPMFREFRRAAERPGLLAEVGADEARILAERMPDDALVQEAMERILGCEAREAARPRARDIAMASKLRAQARLR